MKHFTVMHVPALDGELWLVEDFSGSIIAKFQGEGGRVKADWMAAALNYCTGVDIKDLQGKFYAVSVD